MTTQENIFLNIMSDLDERYKRHKEYDILKASGLIRQLLADANSIVAHVNKKHKLKILFRVQRRNKIPTERIQEDGTIWKALYGMTFITPKEDSSSIELLNKDEFFKYVILTYYDEAFNVLDIIKICANKYGGIHYDEERNHKEKSIDTTHKGFSFNDSSSVIQSMHSITGICLEALKPLMEKIKKDY